MEERLADAIARVPGWSGAVATPLSGGITNRSYRVRVGDEAFVLRLAGDGTSALGIDRRHELGALRSMASLGIGAEVVFADVAAGILVTRELGGRTLEPRDLEQQGIRDRVARLVRRVHDGPAFEGTFSPFEVVRDYAAKATALGTSVAEAEPTLTLMTAVERCFGTTGERSPCHNDLLAANLLIDGAELHIIDWEYAAMGDPLFDVASFVTNLELKEADGRRFFAAYLGRESSEREGARLSLMCFMSDLREAFWGILQSAQSTLDVDFRAYGASHLSRARAFAAGPRFEAALRFLEREREP